MPLYEYACKACGHVMEVLESSDATKVHPCESCGSRKVERQFSTFGVGAAAPAPSAPACGRSCATGQCPYAR